MKLVAIYFAAEIDFRKVAAAVALKYSALGFGMCCCCLIVYLKPGARDS